MKIKRFQIEDSVLEQNSIQVLYEILYIHTFNKFEETNFN